VITTKTPKKRGRPSAFDRNTAIEIALDLFWQNGYEGVGVAELGKAIGINPPSLYKAFGSKHGLFEEAVKRYTDTDKGGFLSEALRGVKTVNEAVSNILVQAAKSYTSENKQPGCLVLSGTLNSADEYALALTDNQRSATRTYLASVFLNLGAKEADSLADYVLIAMTGLSSAARQRIDRETLIKTAQGFAATSNYY